MSLCFTLLWNFLGLPFLVLKNIFQLYQAIQSDDKQHYNNWKHHDVSLCVHFDVRLWLPVFRKYCRYRVHGETSSRKHLRTKVTPDLHLAYSKNGGNLDKKWKFLHKIVCCGDLLEWPRGGDANRYLQHMILWRTNANYAKNLLEPGLL